MSELRRRAVQRLRSLDEQRRQESFPASEDYYRAWASEVYSALLHISLDFQRGFEREQEVVQDDSAPSNARKKAVVRCFEILDEAIAFANVLDATPQIEPAAPARPPRPLEVPERVTLQWVRNHVPVEWFWAAGGLLALAFVAGVGFGRSKLYADLVTPDSALGADAAGAARGGPE